VDLSLEGAAAQAPWGLQLALPQFLVAGEDFSVVSVEQQLQLVQTRIRLALPPSLVGEAAVVAISLEVAALSPAELPPDCLVVAVQAQVAYLEAAGAFSSRVLAPAAQA
jgi:hypothetical protein